MRTSCLNSFFKASLHFSSSKLLCFTFLILLESISGFGQIVLLSPTGDGGFETGATFAANGWTSVNAPRSAWEVGAGAVSFAGARGVYTIDNTAGTWAYFTTGARASHFYRDIAIPVGATNIVLSFYWKGSGESNWDRMLVYTAPNTITPVLNAPISNATAIAGATLVWTQPSVQNPLAYTLATIALPNGLAGTTVRFIFTWQNDGSGGTLPGGAIDNIGLTYFAPCVGPPNPGTALISAPSGCASANFNLTASGLTGGAGITYQWQSSSSSTGPWTNITGATLSSLTTSATVTTFYRLVTTCANGGATANSSSISYTIAGNNCSCAAYPLNFATSTADEDITNVTVGAMNNSSICGAVAPGAGSVAFRFSNYTGSVTGPSGVQGAVVPFSLTSTTCGGIFSNFFQIYVDWNQDGDFADAGEQAYSQAAAVNGNQTAVGNITVLPTATLGTTRMRVVNIEANASLTNYASAAYAFGETEDYCFTVTAAAACAGTPNAGTALISAAAGCAAANFTLSASGLSFGAGITYQWQSANSATGPWTNIVGATAPTLNTSTTANTYYQLVTTCAGSGATNATNAVLYTVNTCVGSITLTDSFGDGWDGATMTLNVNGSAFAVFGSTFITGTSETISFCLPLNSSYSLVYSSGDLFPSEVGVSFTIGGAVVYSVGAGGATVGSTLVSGTNCVPPVPPANDLICNATPVTCGQTLNGTTVNATPNGTGEGLACGGFTQNQPGVWYSIVGTGNNINASLCGTGWDSRIQVFTGANCNTVNCVGGNDNNGPLCAGNAASFSWLAVNGQTYYILVSGATAATSAFTLSMACQTPCTASCSGGPPPANDACSGAQNLGAVPTPAACPNGVGTPVNFNTTNVCATAEPNYTSLLSCQPAGNQAAPAADVWYRFSIVAPVLNITINGLGTPNVALYEGTNCANLLPRGCAIGSGGLLNAQIQGLAAGSYYLQVSGGDVLDQCNFTLTLQNNYDCQGCVLGATLDATPPPVNGQYQSGTLVTFCYQVSSYSQINSNWLHGVIPSFGPGWDLSTFVALPTSTVTQGVVAPSCTPNGTWSWYTTPITSSFSGVSYGPGFFFETAAGSGGAGIDGNPGNNYGDNNPGAVAPNTNPTDDCIWTFCWQIRTKQLSQCVQDQGLNVTINTTGDSESGSYGSVACVLDPVTNFFSQSNCCPTPTVIVTNPTCAVPTGSAIGQGLGTSPWTYVWKNSAGVTLLTNANTAGTSTITGLPAGDYTLTVTDATGCTSFIAFSIVPPAGNTVSGPSTSPTLCVNTLITPITFTTTGATGIGAAAQLPAGVTASFSGNATAGTITLSGTPTASGIFNYSIPLTGGCGNLSALGTITVNPLMTATSASPNATVCQSQALSPNIVFNTTGATGIGGAVNLPPGLIATFSGNAGGGTITISGTPTSAVSSPYSYSIPLTGGCGTVSATGTITVVPPINVTITSTNPTCPSSCNGSANVIVTGGTPPYTYTWSGPSAATGPTPSNLCVGIYSVTVAGTGSCTAQTTSAIPTSCFEIQSVLVDACGNPENIGEMVFFQVGPTGLNTSSLGLTWANTGQPFNGLCTNPGFITNVNATITGGGSLVAAPAVLPPGANVVIIAGNTATTSANLFTNLSTTLYVLFQCSQSSTAGHFANASSGTGVRTFSMNFGAGCSDQVSYNIENLIGVDGASVVYTSAGAPTYVNTACTAPFLPPTNNVVLTSTVPDVQVTASTTSICSGGSALLTASGATSYTWSPATGLSATTGASVTATPTVTTTYTVTGTTGTCVESAPVTITVGTQPTATISYPAASFCTSVTAAQAVTITGTAGGTFSAPAGLTLNATTGAITPSTSAAGSYLVTYTTPATSTCPAGTATVTVAINAVPTVTGTIGNATPCSGPDLATAANANISLTSPQAGTVFNWSMYAGATATGAVVQAGTGSPINNPIPNNTCTVAPYTYQITPTLNGCQGTPINLTVNVSPKPISTFTISPNPICAGQTATLNYTGPICPTSTYNWEGRLSPSTTWSTLAIAGLNPSATNSASVTVAPSASGTYQIRVQSTIISGCTGQMSTPIIDLVVNPIPAATITGPAAVCSGNSTALNLTSTPAGATFNWTQTATNASGASNGSGTSIAQTLTATGTAAGSVQYAVTPTLNGCTGPAVNSTVTVNIPPTASTTTATLCPGASSSFTINATAGATLSWSNSLGGTGTITTVAGGNNIFGPSSVGLGATWPNGATISFNQIALNGCVTPLNIVISVTSNINATASVVSPICSGTSSTVTLTGTPSATVTYNVGGVVNVVNLGPTGTTTATSPVLTNNTNVTVTLAQIAGCSQVLNNVTPIVVTPINTAGTPSSSPTLCINTTLTPITITTTGATGIGTPTGLPAGVTASWAGNVITISGSPSSSGTFNYSIPLTGGCGAINASGTIVVDPLQPVTVTYGGPFCVSFNSVTPTNTWTNGGTYTSVPPGLNLNSGTGAVSFSTSTAGSYTITFTPTGCAAPVNVPFVLNETPSATVVASTTICSGTATNLALSSTPAGATFTWTQVPTAVTGASNGSGTIVAQTLTASGAATGNVVYTITPTLNGCLGTPVVSTVIVNPLNTASAPSATPTVCPNIPLTAITITTTGATGIGAATGLPSGLSASWNSNVITISGTPTVPGTYSYSIALIGGCGLVNATGTITVSDVLDFANLQFPANGTICTTASFSAFGQIFNTGTIATAPAGAAAGVTAQIGYSTGNTDPATWTNWIPATFNTQAGNNDEYVGVLSGLAQGIYYYAFRFQINGCAWQYGGYSATGGGFWGGTNVNGVLTVDGLPNAGVDGAVSVCASGTPVALFNSLSGSPASTGLWTGPSSLDNGSQGTYDPLTDNPGAYTYTVQSVLNICPADVAIVTVTETLSPQASIAYASPICASVTAIQSPTVVGAPGGTFSALPAGLGITASGTFNPTTATPGTYTVNYSVAEANGCAAFQTQATVVIQAAPTIPTLAPANPCAIRDSVFTAGGGSWYEFFVNGVSVGPASAVAILDTTALAGGTQVCVRSYPAPPIMDGNLTDPSWTPVIPGTTGGPASQAPFTVADTRLDGLKMLNRNGRLYIGVAGNEIDGAFQFENNRILLFIDSKPGGYNTLSTWGSRSNAGSTFTDGIRNLDGGIQFDAGFEADYILSINRANLIGSTTFYDLYDMVANANTFLGSSPGAQFGYQESFIDNDLTRGFELYVPLASIGNPVSFKVFGMLINDPGANAATLVSNQFFTVANAGDNNYGSGAISFPNAAPNAIVYQVTQDCFEERCVTVSPSVTPTFTAPAPVCQGDAAPTLPTSSTNTTPVTGTWTGPVSNQASGTYTFTPAAGQCAGGAQIGVVVNPTPTTDGIYHD